MIDDVNLGFILGAALVASMSPGPATLAIAETSMRVGRKQGLALAWGIITGSWIWSISAAIGLGALMLANAWVLEWVRYLGAGYLLFLAYKSGRSALFPAKNKLQSIVPSSPGKAFAKGLALHLTNPKAILFFGALFSVGVPPDAGPAAIAVVVISIGIQSLIIFSGYAILFSHSWIVEGYTKIRRWLEALFAIAFGAAAVKIMADDLG